MVNVNLKEMPRNAGPEYLVAADIGLGEYHENIHYVEWRPSNKATMYLRGRIKPVLLDEQTFLAMRRDFKKDDYNLWVGKEVVLSTSETEISVNAVKYVGPALKPSTTNNVATEIANALARAITTRGDRTAMISTLRQAADLLAARL